MADVPAPEIPVTVYELTDFTAPHDLYDAATQAVEFTIDPEAAAVLTYGFNGGSWDRDTGWCQYSFFVPDGVRRDEGPKLLIVLGEDIGDYTLTGYAEMCIRDRYWYERRRTAPPPAGEEAAHMEDRQIIELYWACLLYTSTSTTFISASSRRARRMVSGETLYSEAITDRP